MTHKCEECEVGTLYHNYTERVEYSDPGPCGGVMGTYPLACPNNPKATIKLRNIKVEEHKQNRRIGEKCDICNMRFSRDVNVRFHIKRMHALKT